MSASDVMHTPTATERASLGSVLSDRNIWLFFVLGFATGLPGSAYWINIFPRVDLAVDDALLLSMIGFGASGWIGLAAAPLLDRFRAPAFAALGLRRSWVALALCAALLLIALHIGTTLVSETAALRFAAISGALALTVFGLLWISIDTLRIDLVRGRDQAVAMAAQYFGALAAWIVAANITEGKITLIAAAAFGLLVALGLGALLFIRIPARHRAAASLPLTAAARPWASFFERHGKAAGFLLAAIALYAIAGSAADYLGKQGQVVEIIGAGIDRTDPNVARALDAASRQEISFFALGALAGMVIAFVLAPPRAFAMLVFASLMELVFFLVCKTAYGFTVYTVVALFALRSLVSGAATVIVVTVVARMTARPYIAHQYALLSLFSGVFWISEKGFGALGPQIGTNAVAAGAAVAAILAITLMRTAGRRARSLAIDRA